MFKHNKITSLVLTAVFGVSVLLTASSLHAKSIFVTPWQDQYPDSNSLTNATPDGCQLCHAKANGKGRNPYGSKLDSAMDTLDLTGALISIEAFDSDDDSTSSSNIVEINANTQPGWTKDDNPPGILGSLDPASPNDCVASVNPVILDFGDVLIGDTVQLMTTVFNGGGLACTVAASVSGDAEFTLGSITGFNVAAYSTAEVFVNYTSTPGTSTGDLNLQIAEQEDISVPLSGNGVNEPLDVLDLDIKSFSVTKKVSVSKGNFISIELTVKNISQIDEHADATVTGQQNGKEVYAQTISVRDGVGGGSTTFTFQSYIPDEPSEIVWTATIADSDPDEATATTVVKP